MIVRTAASLILAFAIAPAFAQDAAPAAPAAPADQTAPAEPAAPAESMPMAKQHSHMHHARHHGHVAGDPAVIDHSGDHMAVTPTVSKITIPPTGQASGG